MLRKRESTRAQLHPRLQQTLSRRKTKQGLQGYVGFDFTRLQPSGEFVAGERHLYLHAVRLEVLDLEGGLAKPGTLAFVIFLHQIKPCDVAPCRIALIGLHLHIHEAVFGQHDLLGVDDFIFGVDQIHLQRQPSKTCCPVTTLQHRSDVNVISRTIHTSLREHEGLQRLFLRC